MEWWTDTAFVCEVCQETGVKRLRDIVRYRKRNQMNTLAQFNCCRVDFWRGRGTLVFVSSLDLVGHWAMALPAIASGLFLFLLSDATQTALKRISPSTSFDKKVGSTLDTLLLFKKLYDWLTIEDWCISLVVVYGIITVLKNVWVQ